MFGNTPSDAHLAPASTLFARRPAGCRRLTRAHSHYYARKFGGLPTPHPKRAPSPLQDAFALGRMTCCLHQHNKRTAYGTCFVAIWDHTVLKLSPFSAPGRCSFVAIWDHTVLKHNGRKNLTEMGFVAIWDHTVLKRNRLACEVLCGFVAIWDHTVLKH